MIQTDTRYSAFFPLASVPDFQRKALRWLSGFPHAVALCPSETSYPQGGFDRVWACTNKALNLEKGNILASLERQFAQHPDWLFGYLGYELKNEFERLESRHPSPFGFANAHFFRPEHVFFWQPNGVRIESEDSPEAVFQAISALPAPDAFRPFGREWEALVSRSAYLQNVRKIIQHIEEGDVYELNYCIPYLIEGVELDPIATFWQLQQLSPMPFGAFLRENDRYALCASPERFLKKTGDRLVSQPIKGTIARGSSPEEDRARQQQLRQSEKERAENMMIVDLVRNDLARVCQVGSVEVPEMFGVYAFPRVHQMISTVAGRLRQEQTWAGALASTFPMGSMTGAPKIKVMELIEQYEVCCREIFSGSIGYISPSGDFDFNVVIRTMYYHSGKKLAGMQAGSAITYDADPEQEWEEIQWKTAALRGLCHHA